MGWVRFKNPDRVGVVKTEDLLRYEVEFRSVRVALGATLLVVELATDSSTLGKIPIRRRNPPDTPQARHVRRYSAEHHP